MAYFAKMGLDRGIRVVSQRTLTTGMRCTLNNFKNGIVFYFGIRAAAWAMAHPATALSILAMYGGVKLSAALARKAGGAVGVAADAVNAKMDHAESLVYGMDDFKADVLRGRNRVADAIRGEQPTAEA